MSTSATQSRFIPERCAELHNEIIRRGWEGTGQDFEDAEFGTWWDHHGDACDAEGVTPRLVPELLTFLKHALYIDRELTSVESVYQNFFYYISDLAWPRTMFSEDFIFDGLDENPPRYVFLYHVTNLMSHPLGIIFDQHQLKARTVFSITIENTIVEEEDRPWVPLQSILESYIEMIDLGKVIVVGDDSNSVEGDENSEVSSSENIERNEQTPWVLQPHSSQILTKTVNAFKDLITAIEVRMPDPKSDSPSTSPPRAIPDLEANWTNAIEELVSTSQTAKSGFLIKFLRQIQTVLVSVNPSLQYIAPGVRILQPETLTDQPFQEVNYYSSSYNNPILIFRAVEEGESVCSTTFGDGNHNPFAYPYDQSISSFPCGLWISESAFSGAAFDDSCRLLLPRSIIDRGENTQHYAKSTDGFILEHPKGEGLSAGLYQTSCNPFIQRHEVQLFRVLESWTKLVEDGTWKIDENGVEGSIAKWKEADESLEMSEKYRVPFTW